MSDWNTRLEVKVAGKTVTPITALTPTFNTPHTVIHSLERDNVGLVQLPTTFTFTMTVSAIGTSVAELMVLAINKTSFEIVVSPNKGNDWAFSHIAFHNCRITSANPSNIIIDGLPAASFNCVALDSDMG